jgi:hypothetical protein
MSGIHRSIRWDVQRLLVSAWRCLKPKFITEVVLDCGELERLRLASLV